MQGPSFSEPDPYRPPATPDEFELRASQRRAQRGQRRPRRSGRGPRGATDGIRRIAIVAVGLTFLTFLWALFQPFASASDERVTVEIERDAGVGDIAGKLADKDVIESAPMFELRATLAGKRGQLKPGVYRIPKHSTYQAVIDKLTTGPPNKVIEIVIPEGLSRARAAEIAADDGIAGDYEKASANTSLFNLGRYGAQKAQSLEGFLFPATYELKSGVSVDTLVKKQLQAFKEYFSGVNMARARRKNLTPYDVLTIASMVEAEAQVEKDRAKIAAVIYNRLKQGMPLGIDATVRFATGNYDEPLTKSELASDSPYNTRKQSGLPPGPINSPGLASIKAAANPARAGYLYFVVKPGTCGEHAFSSSDQQFLADQQHYNAAREAAGGQDPRECQ